MLKFDRCILPFLSTLVVAGWASFGVGFALEAVAAEGEKTYKNYCIACHDSGIGQAPRLGVSPDWAERTKRGRLALYNAALQGIASTAMGAKGGFSQLSDEQVKQVVDFMLEKIDFIEPPSATLLQSQGSALPSFVVQNLPVKVVVPFESDALLLKKVSERLTQQLTPQGTIEWLDGEALLRPLNIRITVNHQVVILSGAVAKSEWISQAPAVALSVLGVIRVDDRLISTGMLDFD